MNQETKFQPIKRAPLLHEAVRHSILDFILANRLKPGEKLPSEPELVKQIGVSRSSIREGIKSLEMIGVVRVERGSGVFVQDFSFTPLLDSLPYGLMFDLHELRDLLTIRKILETALIADAVLTMDEPQLQKLEAITQAMLEAAQLSRPFPEEDRLFHHTLFEKLNNTVLLKLLDTFWLAFRKALQLGNVSWDSEPIRTYEKHQRIVNAIAAGDVVAARAALDYHYDDLSERLRMTSDLPDVLID